MRFLTSTVHTVGLLKRMFLFLDVENVEITKKKEVVTTENTLGLNHGSEASLKAILLKLIYLSSGLLMAMLMDSEVIYPSAMLKKVQLLTLLLMVVKLERAKVKNLQENASKSQIILREILLAPISTFQWLTGKLGDVVKDLVITNGTWLSGWKMT